MNRIPVAGSEYPRLLSNPLEVFKDIELEKIRTAFRRGDYKEAEDLARDLENKLYEPRPAEALRMIASAYGAWSEFNFEQAAKEINNLSESFRKYAQNYRWDWAKSLQTIFSSHAKLLENLSKMSK